MYTYTVKIKVLFQPGYRSTQLQLSKISMGVSNRWTGFSTGTCIWDWNVGLDYLTGTWDWTAGLECGTGILSTEIRLPCTPETDS